MPQWIEALPAFGVAAILIFVPGLATVWAAGARGLARWALAAPTTLTVVSLSAILLQLLGLPFTVSAVVIITVALAVLAAAGRRMLSRRGALPSRVWWTGKLASREPNNHRSVIWVVLIVVASLYAVGALAFRLLRGIQSPDAIAQLFDNVYHLNAVRFIVDTQHGSSLTIGNINEASASFYPAAFHDLTALVASQIGGDIPLAINAVSILIASIVWPLSLVFLATRLFGNRPTIIIGAAILAPAMGSFPYRMLSFGVLYPFLTGLAMLPVVLALLVSLFAVGRAPHVPTAGVIAALSAAVPGVALTHPSVIVAAVLFSLPFAVDRLIQALPVRTRAGRLTVTATTLYVIAAAAVFVVIRPPLSSAPWNPIQSYKEGLGAVFTLSPGIIAVQWGVFALATVGAAAAIRNPRRYGAVLGLFAIGAVVYFAGAALPSGAARDFLSGVWYRDTQRLAALFAVASVPLVILGFERCVRTISAWVVRIGRRSIRIGTATVIVTVFVACGTVIATQRGPVTQAEFWISDSFGNAGGQNLLTGDERALLADAADIVPPNETVVGSPRTGASLVYALADRWALAPHIFGQRTKEEAFLLDHWDEAGKNPQVCPVVRELNAYWALDFGTHDVLGGERAALEGTDDLADGNSAGITRVASQGEAALYEATVCR